MQKTLAELKSDKDILSFVQTRLLNMKSKRATIEEEWEIADTQNEAKTFYSVQD
jgi:hypothetical protein